MYPFYGKQIIGKCKCTVCSTRYVFWSAD